jgi:hypothetical protein
MALGDGVGSISERLLELLDMKWDVGPELVELRAPGGVSGVMVGILELPKVERYISVELVVLRGPG